MGLLRFFLAFVVFCGHSSANFNTWITSTEAVRGFYVISGFLMALILSNPSKYQTYSQFVTSRFLRLWPCFIFVSALTLIARIIADSSLLQDFFTLSILTKCFTIFSNIFILGSDWICFFSWKGNFQPIWKSSEESLVHFLLIPQAWTLGIELSFYAIAYHILRNKKIFTIFFFITLFFNILFIFYFSPSKEPINYRFFFVELLFFYLGIFSFRFSNFFLEKQQSYLIVFFLLFYFILKISLWFFICLFFLIPKILLYDKYALIRYLGHLSFPFYLVHKIVIWSASFLFAGFQFSWVKCFCLEFLFSLVCAAVLLQFVIKPFDGYRKNLKGLFLY